MTTFDAIKAMTIDQLAAFLDAYDHCGSFAETVCGEHCPKKKLCKSDTCAYISEPRTIQMKDFLSLDYEITRAK